MKESVPQSVRFVPADGQEDFSSDQMPRFLFVEHLSI